MAVKFAIELKNINKSFGSVAANKNINLNTKQGEILALLGENGSGKTTLMNMLSGIYKPDNGQIFVNGSEVSINSPEDSKRLGIGMVHQHFKLVDTFSAADNIWIGTKNTKKTVASFFSEIFLKKTRYEDIEKTAEKFGFIIDAKKIVSNMSVSEKQTLEIIKVLYYGAKTIILDEPTAVLTVQEIDNLFNILRKMKANGHSIIIISHKLNEVLDISDRVAILRKGEYIATVNTKETNHHELTELMMGKKADLNIKNTKIIKKNPLLEIRDLTIKNDDGTIAIEDVNFYIRSGEILGVAGIAGCGQKELCESLAGLRKIENGKIIHKGESIIGMSPQKIIEKGISMSFIPEDRLGMGLAPSLSISDNMILKKYNQNPLNPFINTKIAQKDAAEVINELEVVTPSSNTPVRQLSGGNVQKVLLGREIKANPNVLITAYPVRGLDINSSYTIYNILDDLKTKGVGILFVGEDLDVLMELSDKIMVLCHGKVMGIVHANKLSKEELGLMMTGALNMSNVNGKFSGIAKDTNIKEDAQ